MKAYNDLKIFTDGSHIKGTNQIGYGIFIEYQGNEYSESGICSLREFKKEYSVTDNVSNPTMEIYALYQALLKISGIEQLSATIYADYEGVQKWISGEWKAKKAYIKDIVSKCKTQIDFIESMGGSITLEWVPAHSGSYGNDKADLLAKSRDTFSTIQKLFDLKPNKTKSTLSVKDFLFGYNFLFEAIETFALENDFTINEYGQSIVGKSFIVIDNESEDKNISFVLEGTTKNGFIYRCIYNDFIPTPSL